MARRAPPDCAAGARRGHAPRPRGFSLLELLLAMAIVAVLASVSIAAYNDYRDRARVALAANEIATMSAIIARYLLDNRRLPDTLSDIGYGAKLDPWGHRYYYLNLLTLAHGSTGQSRKDKQLHPLNSDYDLYSAGKDGATMTPLTATVSRDDVIRARDGQFIGLASDFDP